MNKNLQAVILVGGKGSRLGNLGKKLPKAMMDINGETFLSILINQLKAQGIKNFLILIGYKKKIILKYLKENKIEGVSIHEGSEKWETLRRIIKAKKIISENFLLMYCDNYLVNFNLKKNLKIFKKDKSNIVLSISKKKRAQYGNIRLEKKNVIYKKKIQSNFVELGYMLINKTNLLKYSFKIIKKNLDISKVLEKYSQINKLKYIFYNKGFLCIENQKLLKETRNYFKKKEY